MSVVLVPGQRGSGCQLLPVSLLDQPPRGRTGANETSKGGFFPDRKQGFQAVRRVSFQSVSLLKLPEHSPSPCKNDLMPNAQLIPAQPATFPAARGSEGLVQRFIKRGFPDSISLQSHCPCFDSGGSTWIWLSSCLSQTGPSRSGKRIRQFN